MAKPKISLEQWRTLHAVIDCGGFAQAADFLHRSQSSVSYTVSKLQDQLAIPILMIKGRKAHLTEDGKIILDYSRQLVEDASKLESLAAHLNSGWEAEITLVVDNVFPTDLLMQVLKRFKSVSKGTQIKFKEAVLSGIIETLHNNEADIVIANHVPPDYLGNLVTEVEFIAVASPDHELHKTDKLLIQHDLIKYLQIIIKDSGSHKPVNEGWQGANQRWTVSSFETAITMLKNNLGYCWLPVHQIQSALDCGDLKPLNLNHGQHFKIQLYLLSAPRTGPAAQLLAKLFIDSAHA